MIGQTGHTESFWRVERDHNQFSRIKRQPINTVL
jgi:hypothetical protein